MSKDKCSGPFTDARECPVHKHDLIGSSAGLGAQEQCHYCGEFYPKPVSYHHSEEECARNRIVPEHSKAPAEPVGGLTPRTDEFYSAYLPPENNMGRGRDTSKDDEIAFARQLERDLTEAEQVGNDLLYLNSELSREVAGLRADAERYRWLRGRPSLIGWDWWPVKVQKDTNITPEFLDTAIDAALKEPKND